MFAPAGAQASQRHQALSTERLVCSVPRFLPPCNSHMEIGTRKAEVEAGLMHLGLVDPMPCSTQDHQRWTGLDTWPSILTLGRASTWPDTHEAFIGSSWATAAERLSRCMRSSVQCSTWIGEVPACTSLIACHCATDLWSLTGQRKEEGVCMQSAASPDEVQRIVLSPILAPG